MTKNELRDIAYEIATGNSLCEIYNYEDFQDLSEEELLSVAWEPFEYWPADELASHVCQIAEEIIMRMTDHGAVTE